MLPRTVYLPRRRNTSTSEVDKYTIGHITLGEYTITRLGLILVSSSTVFV